MQKKILRFQTLNANRKNQGQSLVELAVFLFMLMPLLAGGLDIGRAYYYQLSINDAARQGVRIASNPEKTNNDIMSAVRNELSSDISPTDSNIVIVPSVNRLSGHPVTVTVRYQYTPVTPFIEPLMEGHPLTGSASGVVQ